MSNKKLHPIYVALDAHQYSRAIKLAAALPDSNTLGKALLAHAYNKAGQRYSSLVTLHKALGDFCELKHEVEYSLEAVLERRQASSTKTPPQPEPSSKKGKKGKKKPTPPKPSQPVANDSQTIDLMDQLNTPPSLPENWEIPPPDREPITDEVRQSLGHLLIFPILCSFVCL